MADLRRLSEPFAASDLDWRILQAGLKDGRPWGKCVAYVTNRAIMERLDEVCGPENWCNEFVQGPDGGVLCGISVKCDGEWVRKWDGAENTDVEGVKGGLSGAMKRAAVQWGIGRYLYDLDEGWAKFDEGGPLSAKIEGKFYRWAPPSLPAWALPGASKAAGRTNPPAARPRASDAEPAVSTPTLGGSGPHKDTPLVGCPDSVLMEARDALLDAQDRGALKPAHAEKLAAIQAVLASRDEADAASLTGGGET